MRLSSGLPWSLPITLSATKEEAEGLKKGKEAAIVHEGRPIAIIEVDDIYEYDVKHEAEKTYRTTDENHPGVAYLYSQGPYLRRWRGHRARERVRPRVLGTPSHSDAAAGEDRASEAGRTVVAFQTRNPIHRAHEYLTKCALEIVDGLVIHPLVGGTKGDDIPAETRMKCYEVLMENYYPSDRVDAVGVPGGHALRRPT